MKRLINLLASLIFLADATAAAAQDPLPSPAAATTLGRLLVEGLKTRGALSTGEANAIEAAADLNPRILQGAAEEVSAAADPGRFVAGATPAQLKALRTSLLNRAKLQAIASGAVPVQPDLLAKLRPVLDRTAAPDLPAIHLPKSLELEALQSLQATLLVLKPLCPTGFKPSKTAGKDECIEGDPWSAELFRSVVPILVDGKRVCTGSYLGDGLILTAAHCAIESAGTNIVVVGKSRISVTNLQGTALPLTATPRVPKEMMLACLPQCPDPAYDFAMLQVSPRADADWKPLPVLTTIASAGDFPITIAGYGVTTMPAGLSKNGLYIGTQRLKLAATDQALEWSYGLPTDAGSSFCSGDSGGPIFQGRPRQVGDSLALIGVISRFVSSAGTCFQAKATAVSLTQPGPHSVLCNLIPGNSGFCGS